MRKFIIILLFVLIISPVFGKNDSSDSLGFSLGVDYASDYIWRGMYRFNHDAAFFPFAHIKMADLTLSYMGEYSEDYVTFKEKKDTGSRLSDKKHTADLGLDFSHTFKQAVTLGVGAWYFRFLNDEKSSYATGTFYIILDGIPLKPTIKYSHDYYIETKKKMDFYIQFGMNKEFQIRDAGFIIGAMAGFYNADSLNKRGLSDVTGTMGLNTTISNVVFNGTLNYVFVPSTAFYRIKTSTGIKVEDKQKTFSTFSATLSI